MIIADLYEISTKAQTCCYLHNIINLDTAFNNQFGYRCYEYNSMKFHHIL